MKVTIELDDDQLVEIISTELRELRGFFEEATKGKNPEDWKELKTDIKAITAVLKMYGRD